MNKEEDTTNTNLIEKHNDSDLQLKKRELSLSDPPQYLVEKLNNTRQLNCFSRLFRKFDTGSLRSVVMMWVRMTLGVGILTLPFYLKQYGAVVGILVIVLSGLLNLLSFHFIFEASEYTGKKTFVSIVDECLGSKVRKVFAVSYLLDIASCVFIYSIVSWNLLQYIIYFFGIGKEHWEDWFLDINTLQFNEMNPTVTLIRCCFFYGIFILTIPLFLKRNLESLNILTVAYLFGLFLLIFIMLIEVPFFRKAYENVDIEFNWFKAPNYNWIECFFGVSLSYYVQTFVFSLRSELLLPTLKRTKKVASISTLCEIAIFIVIGFFGYYSLGDKFTPSLFILRKPYPNKSEISEYIFRTTVSVFFVLNVLGLAMFHQSLRDELYPYIKMKNERLKFILLSLGPYFLLITLAFAYPYVISYLNISAYSINNFNGYILPILMKIEINKRRKTNSFVNIFLWLLVVLLTVLGVSAVVLKALGLSKVQ